MEMAGTHATLVDSPDFADSVTATIPRAEFEAALASEEPAELFLEVSQPEDGGARESADVSIAWSRADLERLLEQTAGPSITLAFDRDELERVLSEDVEAHGFREKAAVLTIALVTAAGGAAAAAAHDEVGGLTGGAMAAADSARAPGATGPSEGRSMTPSYVAVHDETGLAERGITPLAVASHEEASLAARGIEVEPAPASHEEASLAARGIEVEPAPASHEEASLAARGIEVEPLPASHDEETLAARGIASPAPATGAGDGGFAVDVPFEASTAAAVGGGLAGLGLLITAAGFAVRRQRSTRPA